MVAVGVALRFLQLDVVRVCGLRASSDLVLCCRGSAHSVRGAVDLQVVRVLQHLTLVTQLLAVGPLAVAHNDHPLVSCVRLVRLDVRFSSSILRTSILVDDLSLVFVLIVDVLRLW